MTCHMPNPAFYYRAEPQLLARAKFHAERFGCSLNKFVDEALMDYLAVCDEESESLLEDDSDG